MSSNSSCRCRTIKPRVITYAFGSMAIWDGDDLADIKIGISRQGRLGILDDRRHGYLIPPQFGAAPIGKIYLTNNCFWYHDRGAKKLVIKKNNDDIEVWNPFWAETAIKVVDFSSSKFDPRKLCLCDTSNPVVSKK